MAVNSVSTDESGSLRKGRLGSVAIVFLVIAAASPLIGMTGALPVAIVLGNGAAVPGAYVAVGLILLLFSVGYAAMSQRVTNTGAFFAYVGRGLGIGPGVGSAYVSLVAYVAIQLAVYGFFAAVMAGQMDSRFGIDLPPYLWALIAGAVVLGMSTFSIDIGAKVLGILLTLEFTALLLTGLAVLFQGGGPDGFDFGASFAPSNILVGGLAGSAGIALAFAFASFIGFEATAIYSEESKSPKRTVPRATYGAVIAITILFGITAFGVVSALGSSSVVDEVLERSAVDGEPLADAAAVLFSVADDFVGGWLGETMGWLVLASLFTGLLAFQNSVARYVFSMGRAGVLPSSLGRTNAVGAPFAGSVVASIVAGAVIVIFWATGLDPVLEMFYWFSAIAVVAIVLVEILVCLAVMKYFRSDDEVKNPFVTLIAPALATVGLALGEYLLMSRFGLLAGTVAEGVDPTAQAWGLNALGYFLVFLPFIMFAIGVVVGIVRRRSENATAVADLVS